MTEVGDTYKAPVDRKTPQTHILSIGGLIDRRRGLFVAQGRPTRAGKDVGVLLLTRKRPDLDLARLAKFVASRIYYERPALMFSGESPYGSHE